MATPSVGDRPTAADQNEYNAETVTHEVYHSVRHTVFSSTDKTKTGHFYTRSTITDDYPDLVNAELTMYNLAPGDTTRFRLYTGDDDDGTLVMTLEYGNFTVDEDYVTVRDISSSSGYYTVEFFLAAGEYYWKWDVDVDWDTGTFITRVYLDIKQGQTNIPSGAAMRIWAADFSDYEARASRTPANGSSAVNDQYDEYGIFGIDIDYSTDCRAGWEDPDIDWT